MAPSSAAMNPPTRSVALGGASAVPTSTGAIAAGSVRGRAAMIQMRTGDTRGGAGTAPKSGARFSL